MGVGLSEYQTWIVLTGICVVLTAVPTHAWETRCQNPPKTYQDMNLPHHSQGETPVILTPVVLALCVSHKKGDLSASVRKALSLTPLQSSNALQGILVTQVPVGQEQAAPQTETGTPSVDAWLAWYPSLTPSRGVDPSALLTQTANMVLCAKVSDAWRNLIPVIPPPVGREPPAPRMVVATLSATVCQV